MLLLPRIWREWICIVPGNLCFQALISGSIDHPNRFLKEKNGCMKHTIGSPSFARTTFLSRAPSTDYRDSAERS